MNASYISGISYVYWFLIRVWESFKKDVGTVAIGQIIFLAFDIFAAVTNRLLHPGVLRPDEW